MFVFPVTMFFCVRVCLFVNFFTVNDFSATTWPRILIFGANIMYLMSCTVY